MSIQPGNGYNFVSSSQGISLDIEQPWTASPFSGAQFGIDLFTPPMPDLNGSSDLTFNDEPVLQFQVGTTVVGNNQYVRIAKGAVNYTVTNMPLIYKGAATDVRQAMIYAAAVYPGITVVNGGDATSEWMEDGGYYVLPSSGTFYVTISRLDISASETSSSLLQEQVPFVSIFSSTDAIYSKIFSETGPAQYINEMNVQKMTGYDAATTGLAGDFGNCHTTWFLPVKWGYACKIIAVIEATVPTITLPTVTVVHAATAISNEVHRLTLPPEVKKAGSLQLQYAPGFTSDTTDPFDPFNPLNSGNLTGQFQYNLSNALKAIQSLKGNSSVTVSGENSLDITYLNDLANTAVVAPTIINNTVGAPTNVYEVTQHVVGSIDMSIDLNYLGSTLKNVAGLDQVADDPYNAYEANGWNDISNYLQKDDLESITANNLVYYDLMLSPNDWTGTNYTWTAPNTCINEPAGFSHPYKVYLSSSGGGSNVFGIIYGETNNVAPSNVGSLITVANGAYEVYIKHPYLSPDYPDTTGFVWDIDVGLPADTDAEGYIRIATISGMDITQIVTGSLWSDRLKLGTMTAQYYFARV